MKMQLKLMLFLLGGSFMFLMGCKKDEGRATTITGTNLAVLKPGTLTGTFTATGGLNTSGTHVMVIQPVGTDSIHCTWTMTTPEGTFIMLQDCLKPPGMSGRWQIISGTGHYAALRGNGTLTMMFAPDPSVPPGALSIETNTGVVWLHP
jgi:hypothetical protein